MRSRCGALTFGVVPVALCLVLLPGQARGADSSAPLAVLPITLELEGCETLDRVELYKLLAIEFRALDVRPAAPPERVHVACGAQRASVTLGSNKSSNELDFAATSPALWPRLLALSVSEIVIESRARAAATSSSPGAAEPVAPAASEPSPTPERTGAFRGFAAISLRRALGPQTWLVGPDLGATLELNRYLSLALDLRLEFGRTDTALAKIDWLLASGALALLAGGRVGHWSFGVGPGVCIGYLRLMPQVQVANATGHTVSGVWAGPELVARARYDSSTRWFVLGGVDSGIASTSVTGLLDGDQRMIDSGGAWISTMLGAGLLL
ncbi:MAG TPA: hypothetical protein VJV79_39735 [Polyangiaceae bacterium]|nr:hypothetical protein [Polyangiaceae bacterium]